MSQEENNVIFGSRLAEYKYYDMTSIINQVMEQTDKLFDK